MLIKFDHLVLAKRSFEVRDLPEFFKGKRILAHTFLDKDVEEPNYFISELKRNSKHIRTIYKDLSEWMLAPWQRFVYKHESLEHPDGVTKKPQDFTSMVSATVMVLYVAYKEYKINRRRSSNGLLFLVDVLKSEFERRQLSIGLMTELTFKAVHPIAILNQTIYTLLFIAFFVFIASPYVLYRELEEIRLHIFKDFELSERSYTGWVIKYAPIAVGAMKDSYNILNLIFNMPRLTVEGRISQNIPKNQ